jgi:outer membrane protein
MLPIVINKRTAWILALWASSSLAQPLSAFLQSAEQKNVDGRLAAQSTASAQASFGQQWGGLLPSLSANGGYTRNQFSAVVDLPNGPTSSTKVTIIPQDQLEATLRAEVPLIDVSRWLRVSAASSTADAANAREALTRDQVRRQVLTAFYAYAGAQALLDSALKSLGVSEAQLALQGDRRSAGVGSELEVVRATSEVERNRQLVADADNLLETSRRSLRTLSGLEPTTSASIPADDLRTEPPVAELEARVEVLPAVTSAEREAKAASTTSAAATTALIPTINAQFTQRFTNATGFQNQAAVWNAGVTFSWRADLGTLQGLRVVSAAEQTAQLNAEKARLAATDQVHSDWHRVRAAIVKVKAARAQVAAAQRAQSLAKERNAAGVATQLDVIQADRDLFSAEVSDITARLELASARASLDLSAGIPLEAP